MRRRRLDHPAVAFGARYWRILVYRRLLGLSAEGAFWLVFSLPFLLLGGVSVVGLVDRMLPTTAVAQLQADILALAAQYLTSEVVTDYVEPLVTEVFTTGEAGLSLASFVVALWAGSRSIQTFVETNMIVNGQFRQRGYVRIRLISVAVLVAVAVILAVAVPVLSFGPTRVGDWIGLPVWLVTTASVLLAGALGLAVLTAVLHLSLTDRPAIITSLPGALLMVAGWWAGAVFLSYYLRRLYSDASIYGVLATPIAVMLYAFAISLSAFLGAALNAALRGVDAGPNFDGGSPTTVGAPAAAVGPPVDSAVVPGRADP
ncbi:MAG: rane protein [Actinomycetota bacterium]|nr:rane protein [Actinomycetota bacterium]